MELDTSVAPKVIPDRVLSLTAELCRKYEGLSLKVYLCPAGYPTIGYGHRCDPGQEDITEEGAELLLRKDITEAYESLIKESPHLEESGQGLQAALTDFVFNLGIDRYKTSTLRKVIEEAGSLEEVSGQLLRWTKARDPKTGDLVSLAGLQRRRQAEVDLLRIP